MPTQSSMSKPYDLPDINGHFGKFGGQFVAETLMGPLQELVKACDVYLQDPDFVKEFTHNLKQFVGRPTPLYHAEHLSDLLDGAKIYLKREDLNHTGAHKINNSLGQMLLAKRMGKKRIIAETGAGQHGVATATVAAKMGLECVVYMGEEDIKRQAINVYKMKLLGAKVVPVKSGNRTLKDAVNEALRDWVANIDHSFYIIGSVVGPHPYPMLVRHFQSIIGKEVKEQILSMEKKLPDVLLACVGGGSNAMGLFHSFIDDMNVRMIGVEAAGKGLDTGQHAAPLACGKSGILHGSRSYVMSDDAGQIIEPYSISAGLDYPGKGPEHAWLKDTGRAEYVTITDDEAVAAFHQLTRVEGIIPAIESSHALAYVTKLAPQMKPDAVIIINLSGRGDKDIYTMAKLEGLLI